MCVYKKYIYMIYIYTYTVQYIYWLIEPMRIDCTPEKVYSSSKVGLNSLH